MTHALRPVALTLALAALIASASRASAQERLCDASFEDCRAPLLALINNEEVGIDVAFWFMEDKRYSEALIRRFTEGVPVRVIMDTESNKKYTINAEILLEMKAAGIPLLEKTSGGIVHWKTMIFAGQNVVEFSGANFSPHAFKPQVPYLDYIDEVIYFTDQPSIVNSFKTKFDDHWTATSGFTPYGNITEPRTRVYATYPLDPEMNFPPNQNFASRSVGRYNAETQKIDSIMFRITDSRHTDALIAAMGRGVPVRLITDRAEYRDPTRLWHAYNVDRLHAAGAQVRLNAHQGDLHQKSTLLYGLQTTIFGSSNWTSPSATSQLEHNIFTKKPWFFEFFRAQFERKWNNETGNAETMAFVPLPPDAPQYVLPANAATEQPLSVTLTWNAGVWAHVYDIYFGTTPEPPLLAAGLRLGPSESASDHLRYTVEGLQPGVTYYWKVVSRTMAGVERGGQVWNFRTGGGAPPTAGPEDVVLYAGKAPVRAGAWTVMADGTAAGSMRIATPNNGVKGSVSTSPADYFEMTFTAAAGVGYRLWLRGKAAGNSWGSDSAFVQFSDSVTDLGAETYRIGTTSATTVTIEDCTGCGLSSWGWNDNAYGTGALGPLVYFAESGEHTIRVLMREDGLSIDQIVLSRGPFLDAAPGATKNDGTILQEQGGVASDPGPNPQPTLPLGWESRDIGAVGVAGSASYANGVFTVKGAGADVWNANDAFHFAHTSLTGDGTIVARIGSVSGSQAWTKVGVMMRGSTAHNAAYAFMLASLSKGFSFQRRTADGVAATGTPGGAGTAPRWVRLVRAGDTITAALSSDGASWTIVGSDTFAMPPTILVGLAAHSHTTSELATGLFDSVSITGDAGGTPVATLPEGWASEDIGDVGLAGTAFEADGTFTVRGAGEDVWGTADAFHFAYRPLSGDGAIVARVASLAGSEAWVKLGVMVRESVDPDAAYAFMLVSRTRGLAFQRRTAEGGSAAGTPGGAGEAPRWVKLERAGDVIAAFASADGTDWTLVGSDVFVMPDDVLVGLAASSHDRSEVATGTFDSVEVGS